MSLLNVQKLKKPLRRENAVRDRRMVPGICLELISATVYVYIGSIPELYFKTNVFLRTSVVRLNDCYDIDVMLPLEC